MAETLLIGVGDFGATNAQRLIMDLDGNVLERVAEKTDPSDYEGAMQGFADFNEQAGERHGGKVVAGMLALAAEINSEGEIVQAGALKYWKGRNPRKDLRQAMNIDGPTGALNDATALAYSQQGLNRRNRRPVRGYASTLSSGWGGAWHDEDVLIVDDEPEHEHLRPGAECPGGGDGHMGGWITGKGVLLNEGVEMETWMKDPKNARRFVTDLSTGLIMTIERHAKEGRSMDEFRWTGGVALGQPLAMNNAHELVRQELGDEAPAFGRLDLGAAAGLHGAYVYARRLLDAA
jgi:hypothetical protein